MSGLERDVMYKPGATFFKEGKFLMFRYQADSSSVIGPRIATEADKKAHGAEYDMYLKEAFNHAPVEAFDHDGVDGPGGSIRPVSDERKHVPADYESIPAPKKRGRPAKV
jgi:hypothetical protein